MLSDCRNSTKRECISGSWQRNCALNLIDHIDYARRHRNDDPVKLLLKGQFPQGLNPQRVADQIEGMAMAASKWPLLAQNPDIAYPCRLSREQSSSDTSARYKAEIVSKLKSGDPTFSIADLTGGMGVDSLMLAQRAARLDYVEKDAELCAIMEHNKGVLGLDNVTCHNRDCQTWLKGVSNRYGLIFIDPARRGQHGQKLVDLADCQPNVLELMPLLKEKSEYLMVKASPMIDIDRSIQQLGNVAEVHIVAVNHECKEVLFVCGLAGTNCPATAPCQNTTIKVNCIDLWSGGSWRNEFVYGNHAPAKYASEIRRYLYEPNATLMKGAPWGEICQWYDVEKLDRNTHLYTSEKPIADFPGRRFEVIKELRLNRKAIGRELSQANIVVRNYPADTSTLRRQLQLSDGGNDFIIATTLHGAKKGFWCKRCSP